MVSKLREKILFFSLAIFFSALSISQSPIDSMKASLEGLEGKARIDMLNRIGEYYSKIDVKQAIEISDDVISESQKLEYPSGLQHGLHIKALSYYYLYEFEKSLEYYKRAIELIDPSESPSLLTKIYNNVGAIYIMLEQPEQAIIHYKKGLKLIEGKNIPEQAASMNVNLALVFSDNKQYDSAMIYLNESYRIAIDSEFPSKNLLSHILANIADIYIRTGDYNAALNKAQEALSFEDQMTEVYPRLSVYLVLGRVYDGMKHYNNAEDYFQKTIELAKEVETPKREMEARKYLSDTYYKWGKSKLALEQFEMYNNLKDSTLTADKNKQIIEIEAKYESEKQQSEIELLRKETALAESKLSQSKLRNYFFASVAILAIIIFIFIYNAYRFKTKSNLELAEINEYLSESESKLLDINSMKDNLIRIIGHDLKGPLNSVMGFSELLSIGKFDDQPAKVEKFTNLIFQTSQGINQLLENILYWAKLQRGGYEIKKELFNIKEAIVQGIKPYRGIAENKNISIELEASDDQQVFADKFNCSIIVGNLVNNALKYSYNNSKVVVKVEEHENNFHISISDTGVGIDEEIITTLFDNHIFNSTPGTNHEKGTGFGLKICKQFVELNNGDIWVESEPGKGSGFYFSLPKKQTINEN